jgi:endoglucanase
LSAERLEHNDVEGFVRAEGRKLVNGAGKEILLRGVGFGSWILPEGYMWRFPNAGDRPRRIERMIEELVGTELAGQFWETYYDTYIAEPDIRRIAEEGFNSVRVPINARFLLEDGEPLRVKEHHFRLIDRVIDWCREHRLYVILDLHGAPGGQTGTNIDDSEQDHPDLFTSEANQRLTVELWRKIAERYKEEWIVAGYDLLNEPLPEWFSAYNDRVMPLYKEITQAIREVDDKHMIILEGVHWATDWSIFDEKFDDNLMLQFHKYWNNPDTESLHPYLAKREEWDVPLFMGEGGENNKEWYAGAFQLFEDHGISWNFWTWKKLDTDNSPCSIIMPDDWTVLTDYLEGKADRPDPETAKRVLWEYLDNLPLERCRYYPEVARSLFRRAPVRIPAIFYGYQGEGIHHDTNGRIRIPSGDSSIGFRPGDGIDIRFVTGSRTKPSFQHGRGEAWQEDEWLCIQLHGQDWVAYDFRVEGPGERKVSITLKVKPAKQGTRLCAALNKSAESLAVIQNEEWQELAVYNEVQLQPGQHRLLIQGCDDPVQIQWVDIMLLE